MTIEGGAGIWTRVCPTLEPGFLTTLHSPPLMNGRHRASLSEWCNSGSLETPLANPTGILLWTCALSIHQPLWGLHFSEPEFGHSTGPRIFVFPDVMNVFFFFWNRKLRQKREKGFLELLTAEDFLSSKNIWEKESSFQKCNGLWRWQESIFHICVT